MKVLDWTETFGIYSKLILASVVPSIVPICKNLATQKSFTCTMYDKYMLYFRVMQNSTLEMHVNAATSTVPKILLGEDVVVRDNLGPLKK